MRVPTARGSRTLGAVLAVLLAAVTVLFSSGIASAHAYLRGSDPAEGATVQSMPATVTLDFNETIKNFEPIMVVTGPDGKNYATGAVSVIGNAVSTAVSTGAPSGAYSMAYRVVSADGHPVEGQVRFSVAAAAGSSGTSGGQSSASSSETGASAVPPTSSPAPTGASSAGTSVTGASSEAASATGASSEAASSEASRTTGPSSSAGSTAGTSNSSSSVPSTPSSAATPTASPSSPAAVDTAAGNSVQQPTAGSDWWVWVAIGVAAVILAAAAFVFLRKPHED